ncbi:Glycosyltransferase [Labilithrix luteola]|uniref:Glycosyltransferase n=2 Tax=Labilithrix luteola TaxID=1391654 RepID=A0A0K1QER3_9BACT|nr:Glycosyltransferase [Labilithrix luteola]
MLNESSNVDSLHARLVATLAPLGIPYELVCVDDGSQDDTFDRLASLRERDPSVRAIRLSRNFGKECTVTAGLDASHGRLLALMDAATWKLVQLGAEGITSFSIVPLRLATYLGLLVSTVAIVSAAYDFVRTVLYGDPAQGFPSLFVGMLFFGAVQLVSLGIIGEYVGKTYIESKRRPLYFVRESLGGRPPTELP